MRFRATPLAFRPPHPQPLSPPEARGKVARKRETQVRKGLTLLEVVVALGIFLLSSVALYQLFSIGTERALDVQQQATASMLCQREMAKITVGALPLESNSGEFSEESLAGWQYQIEASEAEVTNLWSVKVTVFRDRPDGKKMEVSLSQLVLDPSVRGSTLEAPAASPTTPTR